MNIIAKNQIIDQKTIDLNGQGKIQGKPMKQEMKQIYETYTKAALNEVQKIRSDMIIQAFKRKAEFESKQQSPNQSLTQDNSPRRVKKNVPEDTPTNINLLERAKKKLSELDLSAE